MIRRQQDGKEGGMRNRGGGGERGQRGVVDEGGRMAKDSR